ncbi:hypothetical protein [Nocardiopsis valliformis]|uniref:hypothetical protein n=1 Tax=Nocardiopsis valliformis TaxID=239974 RepID=UPI00034D16A2|nr:hypothetical protein [Nocardiopsis valliformis]
MSNPTIVTKLTSLFKGIFGRKDPVVTTVQDKQDETPATETAETVEKAEAPAETAETAEAATEAPANASDEKSDAEPVKKADTESAQEKPASEEAATEDKSKEEALTEAETPAEAPATEAAEAAKLVEEPKGEASTPATADVPEDGSALAEEIEAAEAHTTVASDEVLEKVRKGAAPAVEDLAVPTYDELTLPSIRARLRKLTIEQVRDLRAYEVAHEGRSEFIKMYDNRIAKLEAEA